MPATVTYSPKQATPGPSAGGSPLWTAIKPAPGADYNLNHYTDSSNPSSDLRGGAANWTFGLVHLVRKHFLEVAASRGMLWDTQIFGGGGHKAYLNSDPGSTRSGQLIAQVGDSFTATRTFPAMSYSNNVVFDPAEQNISGGIQITSIAVDPGYSTATNDRFWVNGRPAYNGPGYSQGWMSTVPGPGPFRLGTDSASTSESSADYMIGMFLHLGTLTEEEMFLLCRSIERAHAISDVDDIGGGVVALDHIWDVKADMTLGSGAAPATWTSTGATGGIILNLNGALDVVEVVASLNIR